MQKNISQMIPTIMVRPKFGTILPYRDTEPTTLKPYVLVTFYLWFSEGKLTLRETFKLIL